MTSAANDSNVQLCSVVVIMGVAGSGKTTVGMLLADTLGWQFADADKFHSAANIAKMAQSIPLTDEDRVPWLQALAGAIRNWLSQNKRAVLACSALKESYRELLTVDPTRVGFVYLQGDAGLFQRRLEQRTEHYMKAGMLESQLNTLEEPKTALFVDASQNPPEIVKKIVRELKLA